MNSKVRKFGVITLVGVFGILVGLSLKDLVDADFVIQGDIELLINPIMYFSLMSVMFYEWIKILKQEKKKNQ